MNNVMNYMLLLLTMLFKLSQINLLLFVTITPFSVENESDGSPLMFQSRTTVGFARKPAKEKSGVHGTVN